MDGDNVNAQAGYGWYIGWEDLQCITVISYGNKMTILILRLDTVPLVALAVAGCCLLLLWVILRY